MFLQE